MRTTASSATAPADTRPQFASIFAAVWLFALFSQPVLAEYTADMVWVRKSERMLHLVKDYDIIASYLIALGKQPTGHKLAASDSRTPEGLYWIDWRNPDSRFYLSLHITYPNRDDLYRAERRGVDVGSNIMIHGRTLAAVNGWSEPGDAWTDGCIALSNRDMQMVWRLVKDGTPILIDP